MHCTEWDRQRFEVRRKLIETGLAEEGSVDEGWNSNAERYPITFVATKKALSILEESPLLFAHGKGLNKNSGIFI